MHNVLEDRLPGPREAFVMVTSLIPSIAHRLQLCQNFKVSSFLWEVPVISIGHLGSESPYQDILCIITNALGVITNTLGITTNVLSIIVDIPRAPVYSLLDQNLAVCSLKFTPEPVPHTW